MPQVYCFLELSKLYLVPHKKVSNLPNIICLFKQKNFLKLFFTIIIWNFTTFPTIPKLYFWLKTNKKFEVTNIELTGDQSNMANGGSAAIKERYYCIRVKINQTSLNVSLLV